MGKSKKSRSKKKSKHKHKEHKEKKKNKKRIKEMKRKTDDKELKAVTGVLRDESNDFSIPVELMNNKSHAPETPEEYQQRQNRIRREIDPATGRSRLIKGDGEVMEEIVSKERHKTINKEATKGDGDFFQKNTLAKHPR